jgi:hypothetical protein
MQRLARRKQSILFGVAVNNIHIYVDRWMDDLAGVPAGVDLGWEIGELVRG